MGSAFFFLLALLITSFFWWIPTNYVVVPIGVILQEAVRLGFWWLYDRAYKKGAFADDPSKPTDFSVAIAVGWGFGFTEAMLLYVSALSHATGPGFLPAPACSHVSVFYVLSLIQLSYVLLHLMWQILSFDGCNRKIWWQPLLVFITHLAVSMLAVVLNSESAGNCMSGSTVATLFFVALTAGATGFVLYRENSLISRLRSFTNDTAFQ